MVKKAIIPAAGLGTRMAELTQGSPKEMLPIGGKPMIHYSVQEALRAGIHEILIVLNKEKKELEDYLHTQGLDTSLTFIYQPEPCGLADAVYRCKDNLQGQPFAVLLPDALFFSDIPAIAQVGHAFEKYGKNCIGCITVTDVTARLFGNCGRIEQHASLDETVIEIAGLQGKEPGEFSTLGESEVLRTFPRYVYSPDIFEYIDRLRSEMERELDDVPVLQQMAREGELLGVVLEGEGYDVGNPRGYTHTEAQSSRRRRGIE